MEKSFRLIDDEIIGRYVLRAITIADQRGTPHRCETIFRYTGRAVLDTHEMEIGFTDMASGKKHSTMIYLPSVREDGMLQKNRNILHRVYMVIPPLHYRIPLSGGRNKVVTMEGIIARRGFGTTLDSFMPSELAQGETPGWSRLERELAAEKPVDINDTREWLPVGIEYALIEVFNSRIIRDMEKSLRGGFLGITAASKAMSSIVKAFMRYHSSSETELVQGDDTYESVDDWIQVASPLPIEDHTGVLVVNKSILNIRPAPNTPIDFCSCSQSLPMLSARTKDGITISGCRFTGTPSFPYSRSRRATVGILNDDPHRVVVSRSISRALPLLAPDIPYVVTDVLSSVDSLSLPGATITHPCNMHDGVVVSETFANKAGAFKVYVDRFQVPHGSSFDITKNGICDTPEGRMLDVLYGHDLSRMASADAVMKSENCQGFTLVPGEKIATVRFRIPEDQAREDDVKDESGSFWRTTEITTRVPVPSLIAAVESFNPIDDINDSVMVYRVVSVAFLPLRVGDKLADSHGNKGTVSVILPDHRMPEWTDGNETVRLHYLMTPYKAKRRAAGAEVEDLYCAVAYAEGGETHDEYEPLVVPSEPVDLHDMYEYCRSANGVYLGSARFHDGRTFGNIPISRRRMYRLDNNAVEVLSTKTGVFFGETGRTSRNTKLSLDVTTLISRGAVNLVNEIIMGAGMRGEIEKALLPFVHSYLGTIPPDAGSLEITERIDRALQTSSVTWDQIDSAKREGTVIDPRLNEMYGIVRTGIPGSETIVLPPRSSLQEIGCGLAQITRLARAANAVFAERISYMMGYRNVSVERTVYQYRLELAKMLTGKGGLIREALFPVLDRSIRAVASPYIPAPEEDPCTIALPRREFLRLCRLDENMSSLYGKTENQFCILKRDPVHWEQSVIGIRFTLWDRPAIGIPPWLVGVVNGDYDGDAVVVYLPESAESIHETKTKLLVDLGEVYSPEKQLYDTNVEDIRQMIHERTGITSTFLNLHESDLVKDQAAFDRAVKGLDIREASSEGLSAARDFVIIKQGTALAGALGLRFIFSRDARSIPLLKEAMGFYHQIAQSTLDAKSGATPIGLKVTTAFSAADKDTIVSLMKTLGYREKSRLTRELVEFSGRCKDAGSMNSELMVSAPLLASMQSLGEEAMLDAADTACRYLVAPSKGFQGFWETLYRDVLSGDPAVKASSYRGGRNGTGRHVSDKVKEKDATIHPGV